MLNTALVDDIVLEYMVAGVGEPVVFIHGAFIADAFGPLLHEPDLARSYQLITYHRRGYGGSSPSHRPVSVERQAMDCAALVRYLRIERAHVVGHSFGGAMALQLALEMPQLVHSLTLLEPALFVGASGDSYRESLARGAQRYCEKGAADVMEDFLCARWPGYSRAALERVLPGAFEQAVVDARATFESDIGHVDWKFGETQAGHITQPTLVVLGGDSPALHPRFGETYRWLLEWLPHAQGLVLPGATHFFQLESPQHSASLAAAMLTFLQAHPLDETEVDAARSV